MAVRTRLLTALICGVYFTLSFPPNSFPILLTVVAIAFDLTAEQLGRVLIANCCGQVLGVSAGAYVSTRFGAKPGVVAGAGSLCLGFILQAIAPSYGVFLFAAFWQGAGMSLLDVLSSPLVIALHPERKTSALNFAHSFYCVGAVAASLFATACLSGGVGWRAITMMMTPLPFVLMGALAMCEFPPLVEGGHGTEDPILSVVKTPTFLCCLFAIMMAGGLEVGCMTWVPALAERWFHFSKMVSGLSLVAMSLLMVAGRQVAATRCGAIWHPTVFVSVGGVLCIVFILLGCYTPQRELAITFIALNGLSFSWLWPTILGMAADMHPNAGAPMFAVLTIGGAAGTALMPWLIGVVTDASDIHIGFSVSALAGILITLPMWGVRRLVRRANVTGGSKEVPVQELDHVPLGDD